MQISTRQMPKATILDISGNINLEYSSEVRRAVQPSPRSTVSTCNGHRILWAVIGRNSTLRQRTSGEVKPPR
jgi:hypothetical protein